MPEKKKGFFFFDMIKTNEIPIVGRMNKYFVILV